MGSGVLHWVVQREAKTGTLITFISFADYKDAERHKAELEEIAESDTITNVTVEALPIPQSPN
jgi:hypothetical protein